MDQASRDSEGPVKKARSEWIRQGEIQMDFESGKARSRWTRQKEVYVSSSNSNGGVLEGGRSSEYEEKSKRAKMMRKPNMAKIEPK